MHPTIKYFSFLMLISLLLISCSDKTSEEQVKVNIDIDKVKTPTLTKLWETDTLLTTCESVLYDKEGGFLYVSNIKGSPSKKDGNGFISKVNLDGKIIVEKFATGLDAPKGMGKTNGLLYVTDIDRVVSIDISTGKTVQTWPIEGAKFLNDITTNKEGKVWISDSATGTIHQLSDDKITEWVQSDSLVGPNGLLVEQNRMMHLTFDGSSLYTIDRKSKAIVKVAEGFGGGDGIVSDDKGNYLVSDWNGQVFFVDKEWNKTNLLDTREAKIFAADIEYIKEKNLLLVPTFFKNTVVAYKLNN